MGNYEDPDGPRPDENLPPHDPDSPHAPTAIPEEEYTLPIHGFQGTPEEIERQWFEQCYTGRGDSMWQLTWRAVIMGSVLGGILSLTNLYIGLKAGWGFGVAITACILSYAIWTVIHKIGLARTPMTILENNCMQSTASSAGYSTGGTLVSAFAAYILLNDQTIPYLTLMAWIFFLALLGVTMAIPMKRQMINTEQLRFPSGIAAAETLKALHSTGDKGMRSAKALGIAAVLAGVFELWRQLGVVASSLASASLDHLIVPFNHFVFGKLTGFTVRLSIEQIFIAAGIFTGMRVCASMLVSATLCWAVFAPIMLNRGEIKLRIDAPITELPAGVDLEAIAENKTINLEGDSIKYKPQGSRRFIEWKGIMTVPQRDALLALSDNPDYDNAIRRLYVRSQYEVTIPGPPPPQPIPQDLVDKVEYKPGKGYVSSGLLSVQEYDQLKALGETNPQYQDAIEQLGQRALLPSYQPLWVAADFAPEHRFHVPRQWATRLKYEAAESRLLWRGRMTGEQQTALLAVSDNAAYQAAITQLYQAAQSRGLPAPLPESVQNVVHYDAEHHALRAIGSMDQKDKTALLALSNKPGYDYTVEQLVASSEAGRAEPSFRDLVELTLWGGTACMVTSGILAFLLQWRSAVRAFAGLGKMFRKHSGSRDPVQQKMDAIETPGSWFAIAQIIALIALAYLAKTTFDMPYWQSALAVVLSFGLALVACRVTGETDTTPVGAMGKIMQLVFGGISPAHAVGSTTKAMNINLMAANITAAAAGGSADLLTDLKSGYLLGAHPRKQFLAQFSGIFIGTVVTVSCFSILVPSSDMLGSDTFPAPAALTWAAVAEALSVGLQNLEPMKIWCIAIGGVVGLILPLLAVIFPRKAKYVPSAAGVGLAWTFHWYYSFMFFIGALIGLIWQKRSPQTSEEYAFPIASGVVAGGSLMGVFLVIWENGPQIIGQLFGG